MQKWINKWFGRGTWLWCAGVTYRSLATTGVTLYLLRELWRAF